jgi:hypothetical protein
MGFVFLAAVNIMIILFRDVMSCSLVHEYLECINLITKVKIRLQIKMFVNQKAKICNQNVFLL